jgi:hypothetical protein
LISLNHYHPPNQTRFYDEDEQEEEIIHVTQHLSKEQYQFEFPSKNCLKALAYLDEEEEYSFFDESSFTSTATTAISSEQQQQQTSYLLDQDTSSTIHHMNHWHHETITEEEEELVEDGRLSPLELPAQIVRQKRYSFLSSNSKEVEETTKPVGPSSFLSDNTMYNHVTQQSKKTAGKNIYRNTNFIVYLFLTLIYLGYSLSFEEEEEKLPVYCNESVPIMDSDNSTFTDSGFPTTESRIVLIKLNKSKMSIIQLQQQKQDSSYLNTAAGNSDEGYDDQLYNGEELESQCIFYPLGKNELEEDDMDMKRDLAAVKIQSLWRGYHSRHLNKSTSIIVMANLASVCGRLQRKQRNCIDKRLAQLESRLQEETAMRIAFEKAMEDMTVLMDQQQKILYDRLEQEVHLRQVYESKINQLQPCLKKEVAARNKLEEMMTRVLDQMHETETARQQQQKQDADSKKLMQLKLDQALEDIALLKKYSAANVKTAAAALTRPSIQQQKSNKTSATATATATTTRYTVRKSIVPTTLKNDSSTLTSSILRRQAPTIQQARLTSTQPIKSPQPHLLERPSVIPSNRRPHLKKTNISSTTTTTTTTRRPPILSSSRK